MWSISYWSFLGDFVLKSHIYVGCLKVFLDEEVMHMVHEDNGPSFSKEEQNL